VSAGSSGSTPRRRFLPRLRDTRIRAKLTALMVIPVTAVLVLGTARLIDVRAVASDSSRIADLARLGTDLANLTRLLQMERMAAVAYLVDRGTDQSGFQRRIEEVNAQTATVREHRADIDDVPSQVVDKLALIDERLGTLGTLRTDVAARGGISVAAAVLRYGDVLGGLAGFAEAVGQVTNPGPVAEALRSLGAFSRIEMAIAQQEAIAYSVRITGELTSVRRQQLIAAQASRDSAFADFQAHATKNQVGLVEASLADARMGTADGLNTRLTGRGAAKIDEVLKAYEGVLELLRTTERQLEDRTVLVAEDDSSSANQRAAIEAVTVLLVLFTAILLAVFLARHLNGAARRLREGALTVANRDLPGAVHRLKDAADLDNGGVERIVEETRDPIRLTGRDEFGQVAEAFTVVHREAIRIAAEQAALRTSVSAMFLSLARRSQRLVDRMIRELDQIESTEQDPARLARLFDLDHLAVRMRRNDENLLVLAGAEAGAPRRDDASLLDVLRAAQSEVEQYHRIDFGVVEEDVHIAAAAVGDVVRLLAELLDNATRFSPPRTQVLAHGQRVGSQVMVQIEDRGLGLSEDQRTQINRRLTEPATVDVTAFRLMGFAVVARLAARRGIQVRVLPGREGGTVAEAVLPAGVLVTPAPASQPIPQPEPVQPARSLQRAPSGQPTQRILAGRPAIKLEMQLTWFDRAEPASAAEVRGTPTAGYAPAPQLPVPAVPRPRAHLEDRWRTGADDGWQRAAAAARPAAGGTMPSGLPKRNPQAQLVPGSVQLAPRPQSRRDPEAMRGLATFTRAVQRGRSVAADDPLSAGRHAAKENER
jgi:hypothetical protein